MRIIDLATRVATSHYDSGLRNPLHPWTEKNSVLVFVETESGVRGVGEAWCDSGAPESVACLIEADLKPLILGEPVWAVERFCTRAIHTNVMSAKGGALHAAVGGVEIALRDALARELRMPLYRLLGGHASSVPVYGSSGMYGEGYRPDALARDMFQAMEMGCAGVKIKGGGAPLEEDVARVAAVRHTIGSEARLMVDVLFSLDVPGAIRLAKVLEPFHLHFLEAPTARENLHGWKEIRAATGMPLAGPEMEAGLHVFRHALEIGAVDFLQADATVCGGITELQRIVALGRAFHRPLTLHCSGSAVALAAHAQVAAALEGCESVEMHLLHQTLFDRLWASGYRVADGCLHLPDRPGLGLDLDPDEPALRRPVIAELETDPRAR